MDLDYCHSHINHTEYQTYCNQESMCNNYCRYTIIFMTSLAIFMYIGVCCEMCYIMNKKTRKQSYEILDDGSENENEFVVIGHKSKLYTITQPPKYEEI